MKTPYTGTSETQPFHYWFADCIKSASKKIGSPISNSQARSVITQQRLSSAFNMGEPSWMFGDEIALKLSKPKIYYEKTPLELANIFKAKYF